MEVRWVSPSSVTVGDEPLSIEMTDFDNDGDNDLVVSELDVNGDRQLMIIRNDSAGSCCRPWHGRPCW